MEAPQQLTFALDPEDGWPPVGAESLPFELSSEGARLLVPPLFVKGLAVGDRIEVTATLNEQVAGWSVVSEAGHSTVWLMAFGGLELEELLSKARGMGCSTSIFPTKVLAAIDLPPTVAGQELDDLLAPYGEDQLAVAYPVWRHE
jgi:hypothetical protein